MKHLKTSGALAVLLLLGTFAGVSTAGSKQPKSPAPVLNTVPSVSSTDTTSSDDDDLGDLETGNVDSSEDDNAPPEADAPLPPEDGPPSTSTTPAAKPSPPATTPPATTPSPPSSEPDSNPQVVTNPASQAPAVVTTKTSTAVPPPKPYCSNHPEFGQNPPQGWIKNPTAGTCSYDACLNQPDLQSVVPPGWRQNKDGTCSEIPKLDLVMNGSTTVNAPGGTANFTMTIVNNGPSPSTGDAFRMHLDGALKLVTLTASQGDPCGLVDARTFVCAIGTIQQSQTVTVKIGISADGTGTVTAYAEPGGEADTNITNDHMSIAVVRTALQTQLTVRMHGLLWGGHHYGSVSNFAKVLRRQGGTWRGWKKNHPVLARGLAEHGATYRRRQK